MNVFPRQVRAFDKFHRSDDKLTPIVNILLIFSGTLGESVGIIPFSPAKTIFAGIGVLGVGLFPRSLLLPYSTQAVKDVIASYEALVNLLSVL